MKKPDEIALFRRAAAIHGGPYHSHKSVPFIDAIGEELGIHPKRSEALASKWTARDLWDYGVTTRSGWFTEKGIAAAAILAMSA